MASTSGLNGPGLSGIWEQASGDSRRKDKVGGPILVAQVSLLGSVCDCTCPSLTLEPHLGMCMSCQHGCYLDFQREVPSAGLPVFVWTKSAWRVGKGSRARGLRPSPTLT